jgi:DNA-binding FrmR family transcriptional regulator
VVQPHKASLLKRINRIEGQVRGIGKMVDADRYCMDILTQIAAIRSALDATAIQILEDHTRGCVSGAIQSGKGDAAIAELISVVKQFAR